MDLYRRLVDSSPDGILLIRNGDVALVNPAALVLFGASHPDQMLGKPLLDLLPADNRANVQHGIERVLAGEVLPPFEQKIVRLDGRVADLELHSILIPEAEGPAVRVIARDISHRKRDEARLRESEERLRLAFAGAQEGVWDWNLETNAVVYSSRWKQMLGYDDDEIEPHISAWERLVHPDDRAAADRGHESVTRGQPTYEAEFRLRHKDGHYVHVLSRGFPVRRDPGGPVIRIVGTHFDLTERKKREAERARTELLAHLVFVQEDERRRIARDMHDQFGEQLTALSLRIALLKEACAPDPELAAQAAALEAIAQHLDRDVDQLVWQLRPTALDDLGLRAALANYIQDWSARTNIAAELHTTGLVDERLASEVETALYRIAQEALNNVAKHSRARRVEVLLERRADCALLIVEDNGVGFEPEGEASAGGFGLVGMQERAALVGASLEIESTPGKGTTVLVRMAIPTGGGGPKRSAPQNAGGGGATSGGGPERSGLRDRPGVGEAVDHA
jgi:PAS domain S-box-containing protein